MKERKRRGLKKEFQYPALFDSKWPQSLANFSRRWGGTVMEENNALSFSLSIKITAISFLPFFCPPFSFFSSSPSDRLMLTRIFFSFLFSLANLCEIGLRLRNEGAVVVNSD